jgi:hypothetical protein
MVKTIVSQDPKIDLAVDSLRLRKLKGASLAPLRKTADFNVDRFITKVLAITSSAIDNIISV